MGEAVPAEDLPGRSASKIVPANDLPGARASKEQPTATDEKSHWWDFIPAGGVYANPLPAAETALSLGTGAVATPVAGLIGATGGGAEAIRNFQEKATYQPRTEGGKALTHAVSVPFEMLADAANRAGEWVTDKTSALPDEMRAALGAGTNAAVQFLPSLIGKGIGMGAKAIKPRVVSPAVKAAGESGFSITPDEAGAGIVERAASGLSGEAKLAKKLSDKNQPVFVEKISKDLELPEGTVLDREATEGVRQKQGQAYEVVRKSGKVTADDAFRNDLADAVKDVKTASEDFGHRKESPLLKIVESLAEKESFYANSAVSEIKNLRKDAKKAFRAGDDELGMGSLDVARALENVLDRHIEKLSTSNEYGGLQISAEAMGALKNARAMIAKSYAADKALRGTDINPQVYAKMLEDRIPLTGGALEVAEFARDFKRSSQKPQQMATGGPDWADVIMALASGGKSMLKTAGLSLLRPAAREIIASDLNQAILRNPDMVRRALASKESGVAMTAGPVIGAEQPRVDAERLIDSLQKKNRK